MPADMLNPAQMLRLSLRASAVMAESQAVIVMRTLGMWGLWPVAPQEATQMVTEKLEAMVEAQAAMLKTALHGGSVADMAEAGLRPIRRRTRANVKRLAGPVVRVIAAE